MVAMYAVEARNISKVYRFYKRPVDRLKEAIVRRPYHVPFEGLKEVSFCVPFGDTLGIVGENGAGKSTLLKILAGTLTPTQGEVLVRGRVAALLELGAGFHPEFTGRQNIFLNASLYGMSEAEIHEREEKIIAFAELGEFIDRPLRSYSSGMVVRLAFSVATCVDPDILIIDEALSVGDQYFQKKCVDRMMAFRDAGKTLVFCSHAMHLINQLCRRALWLDQGAIREQGTATQVTAAYESFSRKKSAGGPEPQLPVVQSAPVLIRSIALNGRTEPLQLHYREDLEVLVDYESFQAKPFWLAIGISRNDDLLCHAVSMARDLSEPLCHEGKGRILFRYPALPLLYGQYAVWAAILDDTQLHCYHRQQSHPFTILPPDEWSEELGLLALEHEWRLLGPHGEG